MSLNNLLADGLARIKNGHMRRLVSVQILASKLNESVMSVLKSEGYISDYEIVKVEDKPRFIKVYLKYANNNPVIKELKLVSKGGLRCYVSVSDLAKNPYYNGFGVVILSTPKGVLSDRAAIAENVGGEVLCKVF